ncbi:transposase [Moorena sp. SIOASIH]|uniref:transposase n=1 Tax=Moorena sp. SIOASIH TaxID=2607817 RepID=UPI0025D73D81|nr:transposase [Moorena sp. SIOASIH]
MLKLLLPQPKDFGHPRHPRTVDLREILNGIFDLHWTGCQWEMLPDELPPYTTVYGDFPKWQRRRTWQLLHDQLRSQIRLAQGVRITIHCWDNGLSIHQDDEKKGAVCGP